MPIEVTLKCDSDGQVVERTGICKCGLAIDLLDIDNECICGRMYNWAGQELRPENQWQELYDPQ